MSPRIATTGAARVAAGNAGDDTGAGDSFEMPGAQPLQSALELGRGALLLERELRIAMDFVAQLDERGAQAQARTVARWACRS